MTVFSGDGSFMEKRIRKAGYAVVSLTQTIEAKALPANTSAPKTVRSIHLCFTIGKGPQNQYLY